MCLNVLSRALSSSSTNQQLRSDYGDRKPIIRDSLVLSLEKVSGRLALAINHSGDVVFLEDCKRTRRFDVSDVNSTAGRFVAVDLSGVPEVSRQSASRRVLAA